MITMKHDEYYNQWNICWVSIALYKEDEHRFKTLNDTFWEFQFVDSDDLYSNSERRIWHSRSMHIFKLSMFNWKLWKETYINSVLSYCWHNNMINDSELKQQISSEKSRAYLRRAKILIYKLMFKIDKFCETHSLDEKNVSRLHNIFELKDCS